MQYERWARLCGGQKDVGTSVIALRVSSRGLAFLPTPPSTFQTPSPFRSSPRPGPQDGSACPSAGVTCSAHLLLTQTVCCLPLSCWPNTVTYSPVSDGLPNSSANKEPCLPPLCCSAGRSETSLEITSSLSDN